MAEYSVIYNLGSLNIDYIYEVDRIVRKGETIASQTLSELPGGKGLNQSIAIARAGAQVIHCGAVSRSASMLTDILKESGRQQHHSISGDKRTCR